MSENKKDYSDYISYASNFLLVCSLLAGFTFASITILVTQLRDPSQVLIQVTLFFLTVMFNLFMFESFYFLECILYCVENIPPETMLPMNMRAFHILISITFPLWGLGIVLMFLFWDLVYLALASFIVLVVFDIWGIFAFTKPMREYLRKRRSQK